MNINYQQNQRIVSNPTFYTFSCTIHVYNINKLIRRQSNPQITAVGKNLKKVQSDMIWQNKY